MCQMRANLALVNLEIIQISIGPLPFVFRDASSSKTLSGQHCLQAALIDYTYSRQRGRWPCSWLAFGRADSNFRTAHGKCNLTLNVEREFKHEIICLAEIFSIHPWSVSLKSHYFCWLTGNNQMTP